METDWSRLGRGPRVRAAGPEDAAEVVRLRRLMFAAFGTDTASDPGWEARAEQVLRRELGRPEGDAQMRCFVVDAPSGGLAACALAIVDHALPAPGNDGRMGHVSNVSTDPEHRRQGLASACVAAAVAWFDAQGIARSQLHASDEGRAIYERLGYAPTRWPALRRSRPADG